MTVNNGRQTGNIRFDHLARYNFAAGRMFGHVVDIGCGTGYGSRILAASDRVTKVSAYDRDLTGCEPHRKILYQAVDLDNPPVFHGDDGVMFEVLEHLKNPSAVLQNIDTKMLICSVPNEAILPFDPARHVYHVRHYTRAQFGTLLSASGWEVVAWFGQAGPTSDVERDREGMTIIAECRRCA